MAPKQRDLNDQGNEYRTQRVVIYMTPTDAAELNRITKDLGIPSRSKLITSILERHIASGFSALGGFRLCWQLQKRYEQRGGQPRSFDFGTRPLPPLPEECLESKELQKALKHEITQLKENIC